MRIKELPSAGIVRETFDYNPATGELRWKVARPPAVVGALAGGNGRTVALDGATYFKHRVIWKWMTGQEPPPIIDHKDTCGTNNRWANLRAATKAQNIANTGAYRNNASGLKGTALQGGRYIARAQKHGVNYYLGRFDTPEEAHAAYLKKHKQLFGKFARAA